MYFMSAVFYYGCYARARERGATRYCVRKKHDENSKNITILYNER